MDAANILKPALSRGELQTIGATTLDEYRKYIERDAALERRFQPVQVDEPSVEETIAILEGRPRALRRAPPAEDHRRGAEGRREPGRALRHRPLHARQGDRPDRRGGLARADAPLGRAAEPEGGACMLASTPARERIDAAIRREDYELAAELREREQQPARADQRAWSRTGRKSSRQTSRTSPKRTSPRSSRCGPASR